MSLQPFCNCPCSTSSTRPYGSNLKVIEQSYESLSPEEQERIYRDLYGFQQPITETPDFVRTKLEELDREVGLLSQGVKRAYLKALALEQEENKNNQNNGCSQETTTTTKKYVSSDKFRLMFLRAELFDSQKAALRLTRFFTEKLNLFGEEALARRITQRQDLNTEQDQAVLTSGFCCINKEETDAAGRLLVRFRRQLLISQSSSNITSMLRGIFYMMQVAMEDNEVAQRMGIVAVVYNLGVQQAMKGTQFRNFLPIFRLLAYTLPFRKAGAHVFYNDMKNHIFLNLISVLFPKDVRPRLHSHGVNTLAECLFILSAFGIHPSALPYKENGEFKKELFCNYLKEQYQLEEEEEEGAKLLE